MLHLSWQCCRPNLTLNRAKPHDDNRQPRTCPFQYGATADSPWEVIDQRVLETLEHFRGRPLCRMRTKACLRRHRDPTGTGTENDVPQDRRPAVAGVEYPAGDSILEIGTGSGYLTACLAHLGGKVISLDIHQEFIDSAKAALAGQGFDNVELRCADALAGDSRRAVRCDCGDRLAFEVPDSGSRCSASAAGCSLSATRHRPWRRR